MIMIPTQPYPIYPECPPTLRNKAVGTLPQPILREGSSLPPSCQTAPLTAALRTSLSVSNRFADCKDAAIFEST